MSANRLLPRGNIKFPFKSLSNHTENRERRKNSDKSSPPQPSLFHLCLPNPPPHHTPELTAIEFARAGLENELRKLIFHPCLPKPPPHHTSKLTVTEVVGAVREAWKHTGAAVSHDPKAMASIAASSEADWNAMKMREKELAAVKIKAADVDIIANELELDPKVAERTLREHKGDAVAAIRHLLR